MDCQISSREILKMKDYPIMEKIKREMKRFETRPILHKIKSHSGENIKHEEADELAKQARSELRIQNEDISIYKTGPDLQRDLHIFLSDSTEPHRLDSYPRGYISDTSQALLKASNTKRLERRWVPEFPLPDYTGTSATLTLALDRDDHLDCSNYQVQSFRIGSINKNLQTLDKLQTYKFWNRSASHCVMCDEREENQSHIFECQYVKDNIDDLITNTTEFARHELRKRCSKKNVPYYDELEKALLAVKDTFFQDSKENFLASAEARGLISQEIKENAAKRIETITLKIKLPTKGWLLSLISAAWTRSLYELYWKPRTCILFRENHEATNAKEKERLRAQRDINTAKAKAKALLKKPKAPASTKPKPDRPVPRPNKTPPAPTNTNQSPRKLRTKSVTLKQNRTKVDQTFTNDLIKIITKAGPTVHQATKILDLTHNPDTPNFIHEPPDKIVK
jgi:hypothetical protein